MCSSGRPEERPAFQHPRIQWLRRRTNHFYDTGYTLIGALQRDIKTLEGALPHLRWQQPAGHQTLAFMKGKKFMDGIKAHFKVIREAGREDRVSSAFSFLSHYQRIDLPNDPVARREIEGEEQGHAQAEILRTEKPVGILSGYA